MQLMSDKTQQSNISTRIKPLTATKTWGILLRLEFNLWSPIAINDVILIMHLLHTVYRN